MVLKQSLRRAAVPAGRAISVGTLDHLALPAPLLLCSDRELELTTAHIL